MWCKYGASSFSVWRLLVIDSGGSVPPSAGTRPRLRVSSRGTCPCLGLRAPMDKWACETSLGTPGVFWASWIPLGHMSPPGGFSFGPKGPQGTRAQGPRDPRAQGPKGPGAQGPEGTRTQGPEGSGTQWPISADPLSAERVRANSKRCSGAAQKQPLSAFGLDF